jgi:hypothetical protein
MVDLHSIIGVLAGIIALLGFVPYALSVLRGTTQPSIASWVIWTALGAVTSASYLYSGSASSWWVTVSYAIGPCVILLLSLRVGTFSWDKLDSLYILFAVLGLVWWWISGVAATAQAVSVIVDMLGAVPTLKKCWRDPDSEDPVAWWVFFAAGVLNLFAVENWSFASGLYPVYTLGIAAATLFCLYRAPAAVGLASMRRQGPSSD